MIKHSLSSQVPRNFRLHSLGAISLTTARRFQACVSPLCGIVQGFTFLSHTYGEPRFFTAGGNLANIENWRTNRAKLVQSYHIGGGGVLLEEPLLKGIAEALERYAIIKHSVFVSNLAERCRRAGIGPWSELNGMPWFSDRQYEAKAFPYERVDPSDALCWVRLTPLNSDGPIGAPAQTVLVGYELDQFSNEPRLMPSVTTGTAVHRTRDQAALNSVLELIQVDAVMGHWYSPYPCHRIALGRRLLAISKIIETYWGSRLPQPRFYYIATPGLPVHVVLAAVTSDTGGPRIGMGQGCDTSLERAAYKALIEAVGVYNLAKINAIEKGLWTAGQGDDQEQHLKFDNLDDNVLYHASAEHSSKLLRRLEVSGTVGDDELPIDDRQDVGSLLVALRKQNLRVFEYPLMNDDLSDLGLVAVRMWSPDMIPLSIPAYPYEAHPRYKAYGGFVDSGPHPYP